MLLNRIRQNLHQLLLIAALALLAAPASAQEIETPAEFAILMDADTGFILFQKNADELMHPASMSKLMTLEILFQRLDEGSVTLDQEFHISTDAWRRGGSASGSSTMFAEWNSWVPVLDLIRGITVVSGNDACIAIAEALSGTEADFAVTMTARARELGLEQSMFANSTGWPDPNHVMTARELAVLAQHIVETYPDYLPYFAEESYTWNGHTQPNRNPILYRFPGADGLKTGHTEDSGYGLVGTAERDGRRLILVVNGLQSERQRADESRRLLTLGFNAFRQYDLFAEGDVVGSAEVWGGQEHTVPLTIRDDVSVILRREARRDMRVSINYLGPVEAPIITGSQVATLRVTAPGVEPQDFPLFAAASVPRTGIVGQIILALDHLVFGGLEEDAASEAASVETSTEIEPQAADQPADEATEDQGEE